MPRYEIDTDKLTVKKIEEDGGVGCLILAVLLICSAIFGDDVEDKVDYWNGDKNCPIFTERDDGSMVAFRKDSDREVDKYYSNGDKLIVFVGYEVEPNGTYKEYGYYGVLYNKSDKFYQVHYPKTWNFPSGQTFTVSNDYQVNVCKVMIDSASKYDKIKLNK